MGAAAARRDHKIKSKGKGQKAKVKGPMPSDILVQKTSIHDLAV
jgi:hypothetical protein